METIFLYSFILFFVVCGDSIVVPRMSPFPDRKITLRDDQPSADTNNIETHFHEQTLDHFNFFPESSETFSQRYKINSKFWGGANSSSPILVYLGAESSLDGMTTQVGFMTENAAYFKALLVYIEHRYYGESVPFAANEIGLWDATNLGPFTSAQAIVDYAMVILHVKEVHQARMSPVIVIGASYGGMLAAWFRLKFPHVAIGALASSAPILSFDGMISQYAYFDVVTRDFKETSETCYKTILNSWSEIDRVAAQPNGLSILSQKFNTCSPLDDPYVLVGYLKKMYTEAAQYDAPPRYPVSVICKGIDAAAFGNDTLSRIYGGMLAYLGSQTCTINAFKSIPKPIATLGKSSTFDGWAWQKCTEMVIAHGTGKHSMFPLEPFNFEIHSQFCNQQFGVTPRRYWVPTFYGGGLNQILALQTFGSNIIFSNGLRDPYSSGGVLNNLSDSLVAIYTTNGSHCLDLLPTTPMDPEWLVSQRKKEVKIIEGWLTDYYAKLNPASRSGSNRLSYNLFFCYVIYLVIWP